MVTVHQKPGMGEFLTGLWVMEASTSDPLRVVNEPVTESTSDVLAAVPFLRWQVPADASATALARLQQAAFSAVAAEDAEVCLTARASTRVTFELSGSKLRLKPADARPRSPMELDWFHLEPRVAWFLEETGTLSVQIASSWGLHLVSVTRAGEVLAATIKGRVDSKSARDLLTRATGWRAVVVANASLLAGADVNDRSDHHFRTYGASPTEADLPRLAYRGGCLACGTSEGLSREHCVPNWVARELDVEPVTCDVFCKECNNKLGDALEAPIAEMHREGTLSASLDSSLVVRWAIKTALTLSAAANVWVRPEWMGRIASGAVPGGFEVFGRVLGRSTPGYSFTVHQFTASDRRAGRHLSILSLGSLLFVVARTSPELGTVPGVPRVHPGALPVDGGPRASVDLEALNSELTRRLTGHDSGVVPSVPRSVGKRTPRTAKDGQASPR